MQCVQSVRRLLQLISLSERQQGAASGGVTNQVLRFSIKLKFMYIWLILPINCRTETERETITSNVNDQVREMFAIFKASLMYTHFDMLLICTGKILLRHSNLS